MVTILLRIVWLGSYGHNLLLPAVYFNANIESKSSKRFLNYTVQHLLQFISNMQGKKKEENIAKYCHSNLECKVFSRIFYFLHIVLSILEKE